MKSTPHFYILKLIIRIETNRAQQNVSANLDSVSLLSEKKDTYYIKIKQKYAGKETKYTQIEGMVLKLN